jgi:hypothetical protein
MMPPRSEALDLPPLILHPFATGGGPADVLESSRAALILAGLLPDDSADEDALTRRLLKGRWEEIRMLSFIGKDVHRWMDQCAEFVERDPQLAPRRLRRQSFAALLVDDPPAHVAQKLKTWGVDDYSAIFRRSIGLASVFQTPPNPAELQAVFLRNYYRYADGMFEVFQRIEEWDPVTQTDFRFALYSSGEYARRLEAEWTGRS